MRFTHDTLAQRVRFATGDAAAAVAEEAGLLGIRRAMVVATPRGADVARAVTVGTYAGVAYDFWDPLHAGDLAHGFTFRLGFLAGLGGRR